MAKELIVVGGRQRTTDLDAPEWDRYEAGLIARIDLATGDGRILLEHVTAEHLRATGASVQLKASTLVGRTLLTCTSTEVLEVDVDTGEVAWHLSHPWFNDVHHVIPHGGGYAVASTGLDAVVHLARDGTGAVATSVLGDDVWAHFDPHVDYRLVASTKPHRSHPNHLTELNGELWVTRCDQKDFVPLADPGRGVPLVGGSYPHDGVAEGSDLWFTLVNGIVLVVDRSTLQIRTSVDLNQISGHADALGWCRGIAVDGEGTAIIGFSRLRQTRFKEKVAWVRHRVQGGTNSVTRLPGRVAGYDLRNGTLGWEIDVERFGIHTVFSVHLI